MSESKLKLSLKTFKSELKTDFKTFVELLAKLAKKKLAVRHMASKSISKKRREEYIRLLRKSGEDKLYAAVIGIGMKAAVHCSDPEDLIMDESEAMLYLYRRTGKEEYIIISKLLRRAAHVVYRQLLMQNPNKKRNNKRFLNVA